MVDDHGQAGDKLMQIAEEKGIELPQDLSEEGQGMYEDLQQKSGAEFDEAYMDDMVSDHEDDVSAFSRTTSRTPRIPICAASPGRPCRP